MNGTDYLLTVCALVVRIC